MILLISLFSHGSLLLAHWGPIHKGQERLDDPLRLAYNIKQFLLALQELKVACKRAQAGKDKAEAHCTELELELETQKTAATALRQVCPFVYALYALSLVSALHN